MEDQNMREMFLHVDLLPFGGGLGLRSWRRQGEIGSN